jgi:PII-like signaling protein
VSDDALKLTVYFGERDRAGDGFLADALIEVFAAHRLRTSLVMRGVTGFGAKQHLRTDRLLTLSEDLPLVAVGVDERDKVLAARADVDALGLEGLVTLERARLHAPAPPRDAHDATKLTVYVGRGERAGARPAHEQVVALLHRHGVAGATVLLGVDGTAHGERRRARLLGRNAGVPLMVISVGEGERIAAALPELDRLLEHPLLTWERVRVCKRDGVALAAPSPPPSADPADRQKLMVFASEASRHAGRPLYAELTRRLRAAGAAGATSLRGIWGYHGDHPPHGDSLWQLRRRVPVVTVVVDTPDSARRWYALVDELTDETGLVTSEIVPTRVGAPRWEGEHPPRPRR